MSREKIISLIRKIRVCTVKQIGKTCDGNCKECIYAVQPEEVLKMCDALILMYRPEKKKKDFRFWKKKGA